MSAKLATPLGPGAALCDGRYRLVRALGVGGMASVWLGRDQRLARHVAIKLLSETLTADPSYVRRFRREARLAAGLSHPNLVKVFDFDPGDRPALIMEYVEGGSLDDTDNGLVSAVEVEALAAQLLGALEHIHAAGIVHRDVKPSNVLIGDDGRAKLTDFGIAQPEDATRLTQTGQVLGTLAYMAPEVLDGERATPRSDLYSCGIVLRDHLSPYSPTALRQLVARLTERDPGLRPASAERALAYLASRDAAPGARTVLRRRPSPPERRATSEGPAPIAPSDSKPGRPGAPREYSIDARYALVALALLATVIAAIAIATSDGDRDAASAGGSQPSPKSSSAGSGAGAPSEAIPPPRGATDPAEGAELNAEGHELIAAGEYDKAVKVLERALTYFPRAARTPEAFAGDHNYAYALFNYGQALRLAGRPDDAIPVLEQRLKIPDQTETVQAELDQAEAGVAGAAPVGGEDEAD